MSQNKEKLLSKDDFVLVTILVLGAFITFLAETFLTPAMPIIMDVLDVDASTVQLLTSGYALVETIVIPINAFLLGKLGPRKIFIFGMLFFVCSCMVCYFAPSFEILLVGRLIQGLAAGAIVPTVFAAIVLVFPKNKRGQAMGIIGLVIGVAPAVGPVISGVIVDAIGWRFVFVVVAVLTLMLLVVSIIILKPKMSFAKISFDLLSLVLLAIGMTCLLRGISTIITADAKWIPVGLIAVGIIVLILFGRRQNTLAQSMLKVDTLKTRRFRISVILAITLEGFVIATTVLFPIFMQKALGYSATVSGFLILPAVIVGSIVGFCAGSAFDKYGIRKIALIGASLCLIGYIAFLFCGPDTPLWLIGLVFAVCSSGIYMVLNPCNTWGINSLQHDDIAHGNAILATVEQVGASLGTGLIMGLTALGPILVGEDSSPAEQSMAGCTVAFAALVAIVVVMLILVVVSVKDKKSDIDPN